MLNDKQKSDLGNLDADAKQSAINEQAARIRTAVFAGTIDRETVDDALQQIDALNTKSPKTFGDSSTNPKTSAFNKPLDANAALGTVGVVDPHPEPVKVTTAKDAGVA